jgi:hypothetical protein
MTVADAPKLDQDDERAHYEGTALHALAAAARDLLGVGYSLATIHTLVAIALGEPPLPPLDARPASSNPPPF